MGHFQAVTASAEKIQALASPNRCSPFTSGRGASLKTGGAITHRLHERGCDLTGKEIKSEPKTEIGSGKIN